MALPQQKFREIVFQILYSQDLSHAPNLEVGELLMKELAVTRKSVREAAERTAKIHSKLPIIDDLISKTSLAYAFDRIQAVERNILRVGVFELLMDEHIPPKVAISEAMRLARKFGTPEAALFVNAILDSIYKKSLGETVDDTRLNEASAALVASEEIAQQASEEQALKEDSPHEE